LLGEKEGMRLRGRRIDLIRDGQKEIKSKREKGKNFTSKVI